MRVTPADLQHRRAEVIAGSDAPPPDVVGTVDVEPNGWRILRPV
jgi:hypothetical protein